MLSRCFLDRVDGSQRSVEHVVDEILVRKARIGVNPRDHEYGESLVDAPFHQRILLAKVENVVFVDPWRHDQQRPLVDFLGGGFVLDQLDQLILVDDLSRRGRDIDPKLEGLGQFGQDHALFEAAKAMQIIKEALQDLPLDPTELKMIDKLVDIIETSA